MSQRVGFSQIEMCPEVSCRRGLSSQPGIWVTPTNCRSWPISGLSSQPGFFQFTEKRFLPFYSLGEELLPRSLLSVYPPMLEAVRGGVQQFVQFCAVQILSSEKYAICGFGSGYRTSSNQMSIREWSLSSR